MSIFNCIAAIFLFYSSESLIKCSDSPDKEKRIVQTKITIHFKDIQPVEYRVHYTEKAYTYKNMSVQLITKDDISTISFKPNKKDTTITLTQDDQDIILSYDVNYFDRSFFLIKPGDSLTVSFKHPKPDIRIHNRKTKSLDYIIEQKEMGSEFSNASQYFNANFFYMKNNFKSINENKATSKIQKFIAQEKGGQTIRKQYGGLALNDLKKKLLILETAKEAGNISSFLFDFYKNQYENEKLSIEIMLDMDSVQYKREYAKLLLNYPHQHFTNNPTDRFYEHFYLPMAPVVSFGMGVKRDYKQTFDLVKSSTIFNDQEKDYLIAKLLAWVSEETPDDLKEYCEKYVPVVKNQVLLREIEKKYRIILNPDYTTEHLSLESLHGETTDLDHLISKYKDKVIYIDFWASWCGPCLAEMPVSIALSQKYKGGVIFLYFSTDDDVQKWENAIKRSELKSSRNHFLVLNKATSKYLKSIKFNSIPRYFLIDKAGKIVSNNAPRPSDLKLTQTIDQLLKK